jgi:nucleoside-diphosphate-sugar epimerase
MHYLVTGVTGYLGGYMTADLLRLGHDVTALVPTRADAVELAAIGVWPAVGSVTDEASLRRAMHGVDGVFHVAGHRIGFHDRRTAETINVDGTRNVLSAARWAGVPRVVYTGTLAVFSDTRGVLVDEAYRFRGTHLTAYDRIKARTFDEVVRPEMESGAPVIALLPGAVYGPRDSSRMASVLGRYLRGRVRLVNGETAYCWAHVEDMARVHVVAMERANPGESYIVGGEPRSVRDVLALAGALVGRIGAPMSVPAWVSRVPAVALGGLSRVIPRLRPTAERIRLATGVTYLGSDEKARRELGWNPRSLEDGLPEAMESLLREMVEV